MTAYHGPGDGLDRHNLDPGAHGGVFAEAADLGAPKIIVPPASSMPPAVNAWPAAGQLILHRFQVSYPTPIRYVNVYVGTSSGSIQVGVADITPSDDTSIYATRKHHSGVIPCPPANGPRRIDLGVLSLTPGDYGLFLWCDNTAATFMANIATGGNGSRLMFGGVIAGGLGSGITQISSSGRWVHGLTLEAF